MKLSYEAYGTKVTIEVNHDDIKMSELFRLISLLALGAGFHPDDVHYYFEGPE